jgi:hypothetical protein
MTTSRMTRYTKSEIRTGDWENAYRVLVEETERTEDHLECVGVSEKTKVK